MPRFSKTLKIIGVLALLVFIFWVTFVADRLTLDTAPQEETAQNLTSKTNTPKDDSKNDNIKYIRARTSNGPLTQTIAINLGAISHHETSVQTDATQTDNIKLNQDVVLFNENDEATKMPAKITAIENNNVTITIPEEVKLEELSSAAKIVIMRTRSSHRLPIDIIQYNDDEDPYIWLSEKIDNKDKFKAIKAPLGNFYLGDNFFDPNIKDKAYRYYILNPDAKLKEGQNYAMKSGKVSAPLYDLLGQAKYNKKIHDLRAKRAASAERISNCGAGGSNHPSKNQATDGAACASKYSDKSPMEIFNDILKRR